MARPEERKSLGFTISNDGSKRHIAVKALDRFRTRVRELTCRTRGVSVDQMIEPLARYLIGWRGYFNFCQAPRMLYNLDAWIRVDSPETAYVPLAAVAERTGPLPRSAPM